MKKILYVIALACLVFELAETSTILESPAASEPARDVPPEEPKEEPAQSAPQESANAVNHSRMEDLTNKHLDNLIETAQNNKEIWEAFRATIDFIKNFYANMTIHAAAKSKIEAGKFDVKSND